MLSHGVWSSRHFVRLCVILSHVLDSTMTVNTSINIGTDWIGSDLASVPSATTLQTTLASLQVTETTPSTHEATDSGQVKNWSSKRDTHSDPVNTNTEQVQANQIDTEGVKSDKASEQVGADSTNTGAAESTQTDTLSEQDDTNLTKTNISEDAEPKSEGTGAQLEKADTNDKTDDTVLKLGYDHAKNDSEKADTGTGQDDTKPKEANAKAKPNGTDTGEVPRPGHGAIDDGKVHPQIPTIDTSLWRVVCNFNSSSIRRKGNAKFSISDVRLVYCTDIYYDSAVIHPSTSELQYARKEDHFPLKENSHLPHYTALNDLKVQQPKLKTFLTVSDSDKVTFASLMESHEKLKAFADSCARLLPLWGFDGLNVAWLLPSEPGTLVRMLRELRRTFSNTQSTSWKLSLAVTVSARARPVAKFYDVRAISYYVRDINLVTSPLNPVSEDTVTTLVCPLYSNYTHSQPVLVRNHTEEDNTKADGDLGEDGGDLEARENQTTSPVQVSDNSSTFQTANMELNAEKMLEDTDEEDGEEGISRRQLADNSDSDEVFGLHEALNDWILAGAQREDINVALSLIGRSYILKKMNLISPGSPVVGPSTPTASKVPGQVFLYEMCGHTKTGTVYRVSPWDLSPIWVRGKIWTSYEDESSVSQKVEYLRQRHVGGVMVSSMSEDDVTGGQCGRGPFPISSLVYKLASPPPNFASNQYQQAWQVHCSGSSHGPGVAMRLLLFTSCLLQYIM